MSDFFTGGISAFGGLASSLLSGFSANRQRKFVASENQKDRDFNASQAALARQFSLDMYNRQNDYNNPINQMQRLQSAGINPALAYSGSSSGIMPAAQASSSSASHGGSYGYSLPDYSGIAQAANVGLMQAQIDNINADTDKKKSETKAQDISNIFTPQLNEGLIKLQGRDIRIKDSEEAKNWAMVDNIDRNSVYLDSMISKVDAETENIKASLLGIKSESFIKQAEAFFSVPRNALSLSILQKQLDAMDASINWTKQQTYQAAALLPLLLQSASEDVRSKKMANGDEEIYRMYTDKWERAQLRLDTLQQYVKSIGLGNKMSEKQISVFDLNTDLDNFCKVLNSCVGLVNAVKTK